MIGLGVAGGPVHPDVPSDILIRSRRNPAAHRSVKLVAGRV
jgi:hypothetical protein